MKIQYLIDVKKALKNIPDEVLEIIGWGCGEGAEEDMSMVIWDEGYADMWEKFEKDYPQLDDISKWIENIKKAQAILDAQEPEECEQFEAMEEPIDSEYKFKEFK